MISTKGVAALPMVGAAGGAGKLPATKDPAHAAEQFESLLVNEMLKSMWQTVPQGELLSGGNDERTYRDMLNEALANSIAAGKGIGIKDVVMKDLKGKEQRRAQAEGAAAPSAEEL